MKNYSLFNKELAIGFILLFISGIILPNIHCNVVKADDNNDLVEITIQIYGKSEDITQAIQMTTKQVREIRQIFDDLQNQLSTAKSFEDSQMIFNDTIISLSRYNLFPQSISITQAQRLVSTTNHNSIESPFYQKISTTSRLNPEAINNYFCSIAGNISNTHFTKLAKRIALRLYNIMDYCSGNAPLVKIATALWVVCNQFSILSDFVLQQPWYQCGVNIYFGNYHYYPYPNWLQPAQGWISTNGINGKQNISGSFWGQKMIGGWQPQDDWYMNYTWRGCMGFKGLITYIDSNNTYFLGSALYVCVGPNRP